MSGMTLAVCPHDTVRNSEGWYRLVQYLSLRLEQDLHFALSLDFADFHSLFAEADLVYANPSDAIKLIDSHGFVPLARPTDTYDEALLVAGAEVSGPSIAAMAGAQLATVESLLPTRLALRFLGQQGITPSGLLGRDSWLSVVRAVWGGEAPYGILYRDAYDELSPQGKAMVQVVATTSEGCAFHVLCGSPRLGPLAGTIANTLYAMTTDSAGSEVLADMHFKGWSPIASGDFACIREVLGA